MPNSFIYEFMTDRAQIHEFYKKVKIEKIFIFEATVLKFGDLLGGWMLTIYAKFQLSISKLMPVTPKKTL